jgi:hypothetical protein
MKGLPIFLAVGLLALPYPAISGPAEDANAVLDKWAAAYSANNSDVVLKLYTQDAIDAPRVRACRTARLGADQCQWQLCLAQPVCPNTSAVPGSTLAVPQRALA